MNWKKIRFRVSLNGNHLSTYGLAGDGVVTQMITLRIDEKDNNQYLKLDGGGMSSIKMEYYQWFHNIDLQVGDLLEVRIIDQQASDPPISIRPHEDPAMKERIIQDKIKTYYKLKEELKSYLDDEEH